MKILIGGSLIGIGCAVALHAAALAGKVLGGEIPLHVLFAAMFVCFGAAVIRAVAHGLGAKTARVDLTGFVPRWLQWICFALIAYGFLFGFSAGKVSHQFGQVLTPEKAATFYGAMISFFSMALLFHVGLSAKKCLTSRQSHLRRIVGRHGPSARGPAPRVAATTLR